MGYGATEANDAGLLQVVAGLRRAADMITEQMSLHNGKHDDHGISECPIGTLIVGSILTEIGGSAAASGSNLIERHCVFLGIKQEEDEEDEDDGPIPYWPTDGE